MKITLPPFFKGKNLFVQFIFLLLFIIGGSIIFSSLGSIIGQLFWDNQETTSNAGYLRLTQFFASIGAFLVPALLFSYCHDKRWFSYNNSEKIISSRVSIVIFILSIVIIPIITIMGYWNEMLQLPTCMSKIETWMKTMEETNKQLLNLLTGDTRILILVINIIVMGLIPAFGEEFLFRGTLQPLTTKIVKNPHIAIIITAFIFSAIHLQFYGFFPRFVLGIYLGYLVYWSRSLWSGILAHFLHNSISLIIEYTMRKNGIDTENITPSEYTALYPIIICSVIVVGFGVYYLRQQWKNEKTISEE